MEFEYVLRAFLPPASEGWGKVMFSVCPHLGGGGSVQPEGSESSRGGQSSLGGWVSAARGGISPARGGSVQPGGQSSQGGGQSAGGGGSVKIGQQNEYSLHGGQYASCVHAGGLSCIFCIDQLHSTISCTMKFRDQ